MASSVNRQVAQVLLKRLKAKNTTHSQAVRLARLIAQFQKLSPVRATDAEPEEQKPDSAPDILGGLDSKE